MSANKKLEYAAIKKEAATSLSNTEENGDYTLASFLKEHILLVFIAFVLTIAVFVAYALNFHAGISNQNADWGTFGDFIGGTLNPIFGFISVVLLFYAVTLQRKELKGTKEALESQSKSAEITTEIELIKAMLDFFGAELKIVENKELYCKRSLFEIQESMYSTPRKIEELEKEVQSIQLILSKEQCRLEEMQKIVLDEIPPLDKLQFMFDQGRLPTSIQKGKIKIVELENEVVELKMELPKLANNLAAMKEQLKEQANKIQDLTVKIDTINSRMRSLFNEYQIELASRA